jgi:adenylosuccinate lyase
VAQATEAVVAVVERFALNVRHWARTELGEVLEPFQEKQKGSSAMPHKRNPILAENLCGLARLARGYSATLLQNTALWHERDITHSSVERVAVSDLFIAVDFMLSRVTKLTVGLNVSPDAMMRNLNTTGGLWASGTVLTRLVEAGMSRTTAYETVQALALPLAEASRSGHLPADAFAQALLQNQVIKATLSHEQVSSCFATERFLRSVDVVFERVFGVSPKGLRWDPSASAFPAERVPTLRRIVAAHVSLQPDVLDTEARAIKNDMDHHLKGVLTVRQRKTFLVELPPQSAGRELGAAQLTRVPDVAAYARSVLCNEVMEEIQIEVLQ